MWRRTGVAFVVMGALWTLVCLLVLRMYGGPDSAFAGRYADSIGSGLPGVLQALTRPSMLGYAGVLVLSGGWLGLLAPIALLPALPSLAINGLSSSAWMASGQAHYSGLVLPFVVLAAADGLRRVGRRRREASVALVVDRDPGLRVAGRRAVRRQVRAGRLSLTTQVAPSRWPAPCPPTRP